MTIFKRPRPAAWGQGSLFPFIEDCWGNSIATVGNKNIIASRLTAINEIFDEAQKRVKPRKAQELIPAMLLARSWSAYRASVLVGMSLPIDSYPLQRSCLESAGYAMLMASTPELDKRWLNRDEDEDVKNQFSNRRVREAIKAKDEKVATAYQGLYERTIDFGAHPNEKSVVLTIIKDSLSP